MDGGTDPLDNHSLIVALSNWLIFHNENAKDIIQNFEEGGMSHADLCHENNELHSNAYLTLFRIFNIHSKKNPKNIKPTLEWARDGYARIVVSQEHESDPYIVDARLMTNRIFETWIEVSEQTENEGSSAKLASLLGSACSRVAGTAVLIGFFTIVLAASHKLLDLSGDAEFMENVSAYLRV